MDPTKAFKNAWAIAKIFQVYDMQDARTFITRTRATLDASGKTALDALALAEGFGLTPNPPYETVLPMSFEVKQSGQSLLGFLKKDGQTYQTTAYYQIQGAAGISGGSAYVKVESSDALDNLQVWEFNSDVPDGGQGLVSSPGKYEIAVLPGQQTLIRLMNKGVTPIRYNITFSATP